MIEDSYAEFKEFLKGDFKDMTKHHLKFGNYEQSASVLFTIVRKFGNDIKAIDLAAKRLSAKYQCFNQSMKYIELSPNTKVQGTLRFALINHSSKLGDTVYSEEIYSAFRKILIASSKKYDTVFNKEESYNKVKKRVDKILKQKGWDSKNNILDFTYDDLINVCWNVCDARIYHKMNNEEKNEEKNESKN